MQISISELRERLIYKGHHVAKSTVQHWLNKLRIKKIRIKHRTAYSNRSAVHTYIREIDARKVLAVFKAKHSTSQGHGAPFNPSPFAAG
jgi:arginine repressor